MLKTGLVLSLLTLARLVAPAAAASPDARPKADAQRYWPQWRGPLMNGVAPHASPPVEWSETKNVRWKVAIPGKGSATPVVWGDRLYVLTAVPGEKRAAAAKAPPVAEPAGAAGRPPRSLPPDTTQKFTVLALRRSDGKVLWERVVREEMPHEATHATGTWASASAVTDGEIVFAHFGSRGLYALDLDGKVLWEKDLGDMTVKMAFGEGSSPALGGDQDLRPVGPRGRLVHRGARPEDRPRALAAEARGEDLLGLAAPRGPRGADAGGDERDEQGPQLRRGLGDLVWETAGMTQNAIPTPVNLDGLVILTSGFRGNALLAVKLAEAKGDLAASQAVAWKLDRDTPYVPSPLLYGEELYFLKGNNGLLSCYNARTGERLYGPERLEGVPNVYASPVGAAGRVYVAGREGQTAVVQRGPAFKLLATNMLEDGFDASPVAVDSELYLRGQRFLYRISE